MSCRGDSVGSYIEEESSSSSLRVSREVLSRPDSNRVITWIKPVGKSRADAFWKRYSFPPRVRVSFSNLGPQFMTCKDGDRGVMNSIY